MNYWKFKNNMKEKYLIHKIMKESMEQIMIVKIHLFIRKKMFWLIKKKIIQIFLKTLMTKSKKLLEFIKNKLDYQKFYKA